MPIVTERYESRQYDGSNGAAVVAWLDACTLISDEDGVLTAEDEVSGRFMVDTGGWVIARSPGVQYQNRYLTSMPNADYQVRYVELPDAP